MKISLLVNTLNEELNLENNIKPLAYLFDEVVIVDMSSEDNTFDVASSFATKVVSVERMGYVEPARKLGVETCENQFIMILDADEDISENLKKLILDIRAGNVSLENKVLYIPRKNRMIGKDIEYGQFKADSDKQLRFFDKNSVEVTKEIHKGIRSKVNTSSLEYKDGYYIYHYHSNTAIEFVSRLVRYCEIECNKQKGNDSFSVSGCLKAFIREYFRYQGYRNGRHGFALAFILAIRTFLNGRKM
ncbi:hypothetical protein CBQ28_22465 [Pseudoalteromonas sp. GCY]|uniref:glycosyltransferase n=1 Tax=Pseudoalteromonas sp. GCY TaxID=2003316 RepID=UPI000BFEF959|nr:glycosyltransferase [Pseudoalteromonas sp. GCY]PHI34868.1 hypothetical protein CBQ28_22465 [Pseudoalteromonas sp. GCY]QQQ67752.1 glycosyltransferase [Pseudoalteromonas sp. GCY]